MSDSLHWVGTCRIDCEAQECALQLLPPGELAVRVRDRDGKAVAKASLHLEMDAHASRGGEVWQPFSGMPICGQTAANGEAYLAGLGAGPYRVRVLAEGRMIETLATVRSGATQSVDVVIGAR